MSYTKGPWKDYWGETTDGEQVFQIHEEENPTMVLSGSESSTDFDLEGLERVVKLISTAPELLEALEKLHSLLDFEEKVLNNTAFTFENAKGINEAFELAYKAINKAKGGNQ